MSIFISTIALSASIISLLISLEIIQINKTKKDKYEKYRTTDGLLGRKRE